MSHRQPSFLKIIKPTHIFQTKILIVFSFLRHESHHAARKHCEQRAVTVLKAKLGIFIDSNLSNILMF